MNTETRKRHIQGLQFLIIVGSVLLFAAFLQWVTTAHKFVPQAQALSFSGDLGGYAIKLPEETYWRLTGYDTDYKNAILKDFQDMLTNEGIPHSEQRFYVGQIYSENGSLDPVRLGDNGCSFGLIQYNACAHDGISATQFLKKHPEWKDTQFQLQVMTDWIVERRRIYDGNIRRTVIHHNSPACAARNCADTNVNYWARVSQNSNKLTSSGI